MQGYSSKFRDIVITRFDSIAEIAASVQVTYLGNEDQLQSPNGDHFTLFLRVFSLPPAPLQTRTIYGHIPWIFKLIIFKYKYLRNIITLYIMTIYATLVLKLCFK